MGRKKGSKSQEGTKKMPRDVGAYIKRVKIPILLDIFCSTMEGELRKDLVKFARPFFIDIFRNCKTKEEAEKVSEKTMEMLYSYSEKDVDSFFERWYIKNTSPPEIVFGTQMTISEYLTMKGEKKS